MRISTRGKNAIKFMMDLACHNDGEPVKLKDIAQRQNISVKYLEQIVSILHKAALVKSIKGPCGGYLLKYPPEQYTIKQILRTTEGSISPTECVSEDGVPCENRETCVSYRIWKKLDSAINDTLEGITLDDLMDWQEEIMVSNQNAKCQEKKVRI
ncbi:MAG: Rrf2 family transcriptional regulator [Ruminococcus sp.]|nr:Rrf2 family transcriptional regulator [Ruminococcus sp.]